MTPNKNRGEIASQRLDKIVYSATNLSRVTLFGTHSGTVINPVGPSNSAIHPGKNNRHLAITLGNSFFRASRFKITFCMPFLSKSSAIVLSSNIPIVFASAPPPYHRKVTYSSRSPDSLQERQLPSTNVNDKCTKLNYISFFPNIVILPLRTDSEKYDYSTLPDRHDASVWIARITTHGKSLSPYGSTFRFLS